MLAISTTDPGSIIMGPVLLLLLLLCFTTQVVEARGDERQKKRSEVHRLC